MNETTNFYETNQRVLRDELVLFCRTQGINEKEIPGFIARYEARLVESGWTHEVLSSITNVGTKAATVG